MRELSSKHSYHDSLSVILSTNSSNLDAPLNITSALTQSTKNRIPSSHPLLLAQSCKPSQAVVSTVNPLAHLLPRAVSFSCSQVGEQPSPPKQPHHRLSNHDSVRVIPIADLAHILHHLHQLALLQLNRALPQLAVRCIL